MSELMFPILFGHMTFASHRCWTVHIKKGVALAAEAWRLQYGNAVRHSALRAGGGELLHVIRSGRDPYPLLNWSKVERPDGTIVYEHKDGFLAQTLDEAYDHDVACAEQGAFQQDKASLLYLKRLITEANQTEDDGTTSTPHPSPPQNGCRDPRALTCLRHTGADFPVTKPYLPGGNGGEGYG